MSWYYAIVGLFVGSGWRASARPHEVSLAAASWEFDVWVWA